MQVSLIILAAGAVPVMRPSKLVEKAAVVSFAMFITNEVVRIYWFGVANVVIARLALSEPLQWTIWGVGVVAALGMRHAEKQFGSAFATLARRAPYASGALITIVGLILAVQAVGAIVT